MILEIAVMMMAAKMMTEEGEAAGEEVVEKAEMTVERETIAETGRATILIVLSWDNLLSWKEGDC